MEQPSRQGGWDVKVDEAKNILQFVCPCMLVHLELDTPLPLPHQGACVHVRSLSAYSYALFSSIFFK